MASLSLHCPKTTLQVRSGSNPGQPRHSSQLPCSNPKPKTFQHSSWSRARVLRVSASINEVAVEKLLKLAAEAEEEAVSRKKSKNTVIPDASAISAFMTQVRDLVELVDSRDIVELQLKQSECEITIKKKEALQPHRAAASAPVMMMRASPSAPPPPPPLPPPPQAVLPSPQPPSPPASSSTPAPSPSKVSPASPLKPSASSHPGFKCPMAGTFYRSSAPGAPPFVKVGDKIQKGQVVCIIEAMKLMNEIEADQSGTVAEILVEDGKPVSVDTPLLIIVP